MAVNIPPTEKLEANKELMESCKKLVHLAGGIPPQFAKSPFPRRSASESALSKPIAKWVHTTFTIESRMDGLKLKHWQKEGEPYLYGNIGKKLEIVKYNDEEYKSLITDLNPSWSKEETDLLFELCENYELRFIVVADRFSQHTEYKRSIEELKDRYFSIAKCLLESRGDLNNQLVKKPFSFNYEVRRKANLEKIFLRAADHQATEKQYLDEMKKNEQNIIKEEKEQRNLIKLMNKEDLADNEVDTVPNYRRPTRSPKAPFAVVNASNKEAAGVYLRSQLMNAPLPIPEKAQKKLDQILKELGASEKLIPTAAVVRMYDQLRKEILTLLGLDKHVQKKERERHELEQRYTELQERLKHVQPNASMMPNQSTSQRTMPLTNPQMLASTGGMPFSPNVNPRMQQAPNPNYHQSYPGSSRYPISQHQRMPSQYPRPGYEDEKAEGGLLVLGVSNARVVPLTPHNAEHHAPESRPIAEPHGKAPLVPSIVKTEEHVKQEAKPELAVPEKAKSKRKARGERKNKRATAEANTPDGSSEKKRKKY